MVMGRYERDLGDVTSPSFSNLLPENPRNHEDSRNSKEIRRFCEHLGFSWNFLNLHGFLDFQKNACWYCPTEY